MTKKGKPLFKFEPATYYRAYRRPCAKVCKVCGKTLLTWHYPHFCSRKCYLSTFTKYRRFPNAQLPNP